MATTHTVPSGDVLFEEEMVHIRRVAEVLAQKEQNQRYRYAERLEGELKEVQDEIGPLEARLVVLWNLEAQIKDDLAQAKKAAGK